MTRKEILKELLRRNLDAFNVKLDTYLSIRFEGNNYIISYKSIEVLKGVITDYEMDFEGQKKFILDVGNSLFYLFKEKSDMEADELTYNSVKGFKLIIGRGDVFLKKYGVKINKDVLKITDKIKSDEDYKNFLEDIFKRIKIYLDGDKIFVINETLEDDNYLYINIKIYEVTLLIDYVDEFDYSFLSDYINSLRRLKRRKELKIYFSDVEEKEAEKAVEYIKKLVYG